MPRRLAGQFSAPDAARLHPQVGAPQRIHALLGGAIAGRCRSRLVCLRPLGRTPRAAARLAGASAGAHLLRHRAGLAAGRPGSGTAVVGSGTRRARRAHAGGLGHGQPVAFAAGDRL